MEMSIKTSRTFLVIVAVLLALGSTADIQGAPGGYEEIDWKRLTDLIEVKKLFVEEMTKYMIKLKKQRDSRGCGTARHEMDQSLSSITSNLISEIAGTTAVLQDSSRTLREEMGRETCPGGPHTPCDNAEDWRCKTGECIPKARRCDASRDCLDGSDETPSCSVLQCVRKDSFKCAFIDLCIPVDSRCNNIWECPDGSDENNCEFTCTETQFRCARDRVCVPLRWRCDGVRDCGDGSDEAGCHQLPHPVQERMLQASPTAASPTAASPTAASPTAASPTAASPTAASPTAASPTAASPTAASPTAASPLTLPITSTLHSTESPCDSGLVFCSKDNTCIPRVWLCDGAPDCTDGSDEADCRAAVGLRAMPPVLTRSRPPTLSTAVSPCGSGLVFCSTDNACLPRAWLCDGFPDCSDESDEANCQVAAAGPQDEPVFADPAPRTPPTSPPLAPPTSPPLAPPTSPPSTRPTSLHTERVMPTASLLYRYVWSFCRV